MNYDRKLIEEPLILEPEDYPGEEWTTICKVFGMEMAERIVVSNFTLETYGVAKEIITIEQWKGALEYLNFLIAEFASIGWPGRFGLDEVLVPLKKRYESGERTGKLYHEIMECE